MTTSAVQSLSPTAARKRRQRKARAYAWRYALIAAALIFFSFPAFWIATIAFKSSSEYFRNPPVWIPANPNIVQNLDKVIRTGGLTAIGNSLIVTVSATAIALVVGTLAAYSLARFNTGGNNFAFWILSQRFLPPVSVVFPVFLLFRALRWVDTFHGLIVLYATFSLPFVVWMMRSYIREVPIEVEESAQVDGASRLRTIISITLPLASPGLIATGIFTFIFNWNEFLFALVLSRTNVITYPVKLTSYFGPESAFWGEAATVSLIATLPVVIATLLMQRYLATGLTLGAVK
ncbi:MAG: binding-protein-dependent transport systems inner membrane component [Candidatus Roseilinea sp.]|nr:MAG: binding-protein-dependent transport systems inner membrane component [Candidatus Roseilinea sp.]